MANEKIRTIRDDWFIDETKREDGKTSISYGERHGISHGPRGHLVENPDGSTAYSRNADGKVLFDDTKE